MHGAAADSADGAAQGVEDANLELHPRTAGEVQVICLADKGRELFGVCHVTPQVSTKTLYVLHLVYQLDRRGELSAVN